ncbi:MAG: TonB-dependent receptor [Sulfurimonas sp.]
MKFLVILSLLLSSVYAQESNLDDLLSKYRQANELHNETKDEKSGHVIVYSRSDLDKMQAYTLNDVLKTIKLFTLKSTNFGLTSLVKTPYAESSMPSIKIYINSYELSSITTGSGLAQYGKMGLNHIDHIEIYQASNTISFHGESGNMVIKLYTKDPSKENATVLQASADSKGGTRGQIIDAQSFDEYSYLANADVSNNNYDEKISPNGSLYSRDGNRGQFYFNFTKKDDYIIEGGASVEDYNLYSGFASSITGGDINTKYTYLSFTKQFEKNIELIFSTTYETVDIANTDSLGINLFDGSSSNALEIQNGSFTHDLVLQKRDTYKDNNLLYGIQIKKKAFFLDSFKSNGVEKPIILGPKNLDIYMLFFEDTYNINDSNKITFSTKFDHFENHATKSTTENILRLAYISRLNDELSVKTIIQNGYVYPLATQTTFSPLYNINPNLERSKVSIAKAEIEYEKDDLTLTLGAAASKSKNNIVFNPTLNMYVNNDSSSDFSQMSLGTEYRFSAENKIILEYFKAFKENGNLSSDSGALLQLYTTYGKFDIYNELVYRSSYRGIDNVYVDDGYDYTAGAIYHHNKDINIKLKGENLFDKAIESSIKGVSIPSLERRLILTLEYIF